MNYLQSSIIGSPTVIVYLTFQNCSDVCSFSVADNEVLQGSTKTNDNLNPEIVRILYEIKESIIDLNYSLPTS